MDTDPGRIRYYIAASSAAYARDLDRGIDRRRQRAHAEMGGVVRSFDLFYALGWGDYMPFLRLPR